MSYLRRKQLPRNKINTSNPAHTNVSSGVNSLLRRLAKNTMRNINHTRKARQNAMSVHPTFDPANEDSGVTIESVGGRRRKTRRTRHKK